jgi:hypothetical protein
MSLPRKPIAPAATQTSAAKAPAAHFGTTLNLCLIFQPLPRRHRVERKPCPLPNPSPLNGARLSPSSVFPEFGQRRSALAKYPGPLRVEIEVRWLNREKPTA